MKARDCLHNIKYKNIPIISLCILLLFAGCIPNTVDKPAPPEDFSDAEVSQPHEELPYISESELLGEYYIPQAIITPDSPDSLSVARSVNIQSPGQYPGETNLKASERRVSWITDTWSLTNSGTQPLYFEFVYPYFRTYEGDFATDFQPLHQKGDSFEYSEVGGTSAEDYQADCYYDTVYDKIMSGEYYEYAFSKAPTLDEPVTVISIRRSDKGNFQIALSGLAEEQRVYVYGGRPRSDGNTEGTQFFRLDSYNTSYYDESMLSLIVITGEFTGSYKITWENGSSIKEDISSKISSSTMGKVLDELISMWYSPEGRKLDELIIAKRNDLIFKAFAKWSKDGYPTIGKSDDFTFGVRFSYKPFWDLSKLYGVSSRTVTYDVVSTTLQPGQSVDIPCYVRLFSTSTLTFLPRTEDSPEYGAFPLTVTCNLHDVEFGGSSLGLEFQTEKGKFIAEDSATIDPNKEGQYLILKSKLY